MKDNILSILDSQLNILEKDICCIYLYGSRCYGTYSDNSDYDITVIIYDDIDYSEHIIGNYNFHIQSKKYFENRLQENDIQAFENVLYPNKILEKESFDIRINDSLFRKNVSSICSNSWVKAKKKILQGDILVGQKSLFHSIRIPMYAIQIKNTGNIYDWEVANDYWEDIKSIDDWNILKSKYQKIKNKYISEFRKLCPK